jgi:type VI secretion system protein VasD
MRLFFLPALLALVLSGCAHTRVRCEFPPPFHLKLQASHRLNPDAAGRSLPTLVRVLQLGNTARFEKADFSALWDRPEEVLGTDLIRSDELTVDPGEASDHWYRCESKATHVAVVAMFREPAGTFWRSAVPLPLSEKCPEAPPPDRSGLPKREDVQIKFTLEDFRVQAVVGPGPKL